MAQRQGSGQKTKSGQYMVYMEVNHVVAAQASVNTLV